MNANPHVSCHYCRSEHTEPQTHLPSRYGAQEGPGERYIFRCLDCNECFRDIWPEPTDEQMGYAGDGTFAANH